MSPASLPARQGRVLFAYLVLMRRRVSRRDELVEAIWGERAPADPAGALAAVLSRLRRVVGAHRLPAGGAIQLRLGDSAAVDVETALAAPSIARAALDDDRAEQALELAAGALEIVEQPLLPEFERDWLDERRREPVTSSRRWSSSPLRRRCAPVARRCSARSCSRGAASSASASASRSTPR